MLSQAYYHITHKIREKYPDAVFYAVSRLRFRYMKIEDWNNTFIWLRELAPSEELRKGYKSNLISWEEYKPRYLAEMDNPISKELMLKIAQEAAVKPVFLFCHCGPKEGEKCHRFLLLDMIYRVAQNNGIDLQVRKTGYSQPNKFIRNKKKASDLFVF